MGPVVFACDEGYAMPLATALRSLVDANPDIWPLEFHVLFDEFSEQNKTRVANSLPAGAATIQWHPVDLALYQGFENPHYVSRMMFGRLLIPHIFPDTVARVLYLDPDILVLDDLRPLWQTDLQGAALAAVEDHIDRLLKAGAPSVKDVPRVQCYFNSGVLLIDMARWRAQQISERALAYLKDHSRSLFPDQDALNVVCDGSWKRLDPRWNFHEYHYDIKLAEMTDRPGIVHFVTNLKPWKPNSLSPNHAFYDSFRNRTAFARTMQEKLADALEGDWCRFKKFLKRSSLVTSLWHRLKTKPVGRTG